MVKNSQKHVYVICELAHLTEIKSHNLGDLNDITIEIKIWNLVQCIDNSLHSNKTESIIYFPPDIFQPGELVALCTTATAA